MSIEQDMGAAAYEASRLAAGKVLGDAITKAHPGLPELRWSAIKMGDRWHAGGCAATDLNDAETRRIVAAYAAALGGSGPREVERDEAGFEFETEAVFDGVGVTVWGVLLYA